MKYSSYKEGDRLTASVVFSIVFYAALFLLFQFVLVFPLSKPEPFTGPIFVTLETTDVLPALTRAVVETKIEKKVEDKTIGPVTDTVTVEKKDAKKDATQAKKDALPISKKDATKTTVKDASTVKKDAKTTVKESSAVKKDTKVADANTTSEVKAADKTTTDNSPVTDKGTVPVNNGTDAKAANEEGSALSKDSLSELDKALGQKESKEGNASSSGDPSGKKDAASAKEDSTLTIKWEDNKNRKPLSMSKPVIPDWVAKQGVRLSVEIDFTLTPQGFLTGIKVGKSTGYTDVDAAVIDALRKWKFEAVGGSTNVAGRIKYIISVH